MLKPVRFGHHPYGHHRFIQVQPGGSVDLKVDKRGSVDSNTWGRWMPKTQCSCPPPGAVRDKKRAVPRADLPRALPRLGHTVARAGRRSGGGSGSTQNPSPSFIQEARLGRQYPDGS